MNPKDPHSIVAIEIEHRSSFAQARKNIMKMKEWAHISKTRHCGLLQIFNEDCNIKVDPISSLIQYAKQEERKGLGFTYEFMQYDVFDYRTTWRTAQRLAESKQFELRLWLLMQQARLV